MLTNKAGLRPETRGPQKHEKGPKKPLSPMHVRVKNIRNRTIAKCLFSLSYLKDSEAHFLRNHSKSNLEHVFKAKKVAYFMISVKFIKSMFLDLHFSPKRLKHFMYFPKKHIFRFFHTSTRFLKISTPCFL